MAKITKKIRPEEESKDPVEKESHLGNIRKTVRKDGEKDDINKGETIDKNDGNKEKGLSPEELSNWLITFFGKEMFENLKDNPNFNIPFTEEDISLNSWLEKVVKTIFSFEDLVKAGRIVSEKYFKVVNTLELSKKNEEDLKSLKKNYSELKEQYEHIKQKRIRIERENKISLPLKELIEVVFDLDDKNVANIKTQLYQSLEDPSDNLKSFILAFFKGWKFVEKCIDDLGDDEKENIDIAQKAARELLREISGYYIPERRSILDGVADFITSKFTEYIFISSEQSIQIDPTIHNANGVGGTRIKEGMSFAVLRSENRQVYQYADIVVQ